MTAACSLLLCFDVQVNLEELRRVKQLLVELESKAETMRCGGGGVGRVGQGLLADEEFIVSSTIQLNSQD